MCSTEKGKRESVPRTWGTRGKTKLGIVYTVVLGPILQESHESFCYAMGFIDSYSCFWAVSQWRLKLKKNASGDEVLGCDIHLLITEVNWEYNQFSSANQSNVVTSTIHPTSTEKNFTTALSFFNLQTWTSYFEMSLRSSTNSERTSTNSHSTWILLQLSPIGPSPSKMYFTVKVQDLSVQVLFFFFAWKNDNQSIFVHICTEVHNTLNIETNHEMSEKVSLPPTAQVEVPDKRSNKTVT